MKSAKLDSYLVNEIEAGRQNPVFRIILDYKAILFVKLFYILLTPDYLLLNSGSLHAILDTQYAIRIIIH